LSANVAGYILLVISFQLPQVLEGRRLLDVVGRLLDLVTNGVTGFLQLIIGHQGGGLRDIDSVTFDEVNTIFKSLSPNAEAPLGSARITWLGAMASDDAKCLDYNDKVGRYARFFNADVVALLNKIEFSRHSAGMRSVRQYGLNIPRRHQQSRFDGVDRELF
jgi:hypothetical protein